MTDPNQTAEEAAVDAGLLNRPVTVAQVSATIKTAVGFAFASIALLSATLATVSNNLGGSLTGSLPNPQIAPGVVTSAMLAPGVLSSSSVLVVPTRVASSATDTMSSADFAVCLSGTTQENLEPSPRLGTTHVLIDCRAPNSGGPITVLTSGSDIINGASSYKINNSQQTINVTYFGTTLGWRVY